MIFIFFLHYDSKDVIIILYCGGYMKTNKTNRLLGSIFIFILSFLIFYFGQYLQLVPIILFDIKYPTDNMLTYSLLNLFSNVCILLLLFWLFKVPLKEDFKKFKKKPFKMMDTAFKFYMLGLVGMMLSNIIITFVLGGGGAENEKVVQSMISSAPFLMVLNAGILAPIIEEVVFRKAMDGLFKKKIFYVLASGLLFGGLHVVSTTASFLDLLYIIPYSSLGFSFAYMDREEECVYPSIIMHMLHNTVLTIISIIA